MKALLFTPSFDDRLSKGKIGSRIGLESDALPFERNFDFFSYIEQALKQMPTLKCILIDEAQFLVKKQVEQLANVADQLRIPVLCYGLRTDFQGELFEGSHYLLAWAQELIEIKTICHCGSKATMNIRIDALGKKVIEGQQVEIGGNERYVAVCHKHFVLGES